MAKSRIARNVGDKAVERLERRPAQNDRSADVEHREILRQALSGEPGDCKEIAARLRALTRGRKHTPAEILLRESRDER